MATAQQFQTMLLHPASVDLSSPAAGGIGSTLAFARVQADRRTENRRAGICTAKLGRQTFSVTRDQARELRRAGARWVGAAFYDPA